MSRHGEVLKPVGAVLCAVTAGMMGWSGWAMSDGTAPPDTLRSDIVADFKPPADETDYLLRQVMIPMRDGVRLRALIAMRKGVTRGPLLLERTPYGADSVAFHSGGEHLAARVSLMNRPFVEDGYILVWEDIRGRSQSEGTFVLNRPLAGPLNPTGIDEATDAFDSIDWLVKNVPESDQRVGIIGGSYDGALALSAALNAHPNLKAFVAINPMVDVWKGDDWFHNGAFRQITLGVLPIMLTGKERGTPRPSGSADLYSTYLESGSAGDAMRRYGLDQFSPAQKFMEHPSDDAYWREQALDSVLPSRHIASVPTLLVAGMWDEQDQYGAPAMFEALRAQNSNRPVTLLLGPWNHMGVAGDGSRLGALKFIEDTATAARRDVIKPFLDGRLKQDAVAENLAPIVSFTTGSEQWHSSSSLPAPSRAIYLRERGGLSFEAPAGEGPGWDEYVSDPAHPVGVLAGPFNFARTWATSLVVDQRFAAERPDVLTYRSPPLEGPVHILGSPEADLFASTSGTDSDCMHCRWSITPSCPDTGSWHRSSPPGFQHTTAIRRPACKTFSMLEHRTTSLRNSAYFVNPRTPAK